MREDTLLSMSTIAEAPRNPFVFGSPVRERQRFFDRESITKQIMSRLHTLQDSSIIGERRMGKTSLLYHLHETTVARQHGLDPDHYAFVYFSFEGAGQLTPTRFWQRLLELLALQIPDGALRASIDALKAQAEIDPIDVEDLFASIAGSGMKVVFLLDEFETVTQAVNLDADFFSHLRSLATGRYMAIVFVTSSRQKLSELSHAGIVGSPFFNIFETFFLTPFRPDTAETMLQVSLEGTGVRFSDLELRYLLRLTGGHPFFLQMAASYLFDAYTMGGGSHTGPRLEQVEQAFGTQADAHLAHYWSQSTEEEQIFLFVLALLTQTAAGNGLDMERMKQAYRDADVPARVLSERGLVVLSASGYGSLSPVYDRWIIRELTSNGGRGDYSDWLRQHEPYFSGSVAPLYARAQEIASFANDRYWHMLTALLTRCEDPNGLLDLVAQFSTATAGAPVWRDFQEP